MKKKEIKKKREENKLGTVLNVSDNSFKEKVYTHKILKVRNWYKNTEVIHIIPQFNSGARTECTIYYA